MQKKSIGGAPKTWQGMLSVILGRGKNSNDSHIVGSGIRKIRARRKIRNKIAKLSRRKNR